MVIFQGSKTNHFLWTYLRHHGNIKEQQCDIGPQTALSRGICAPTIGIYHTSKRLWVDGVD